MDRDRDGRKIREDCGESKQTALFTYICIKLPKNKQLQNGQQWIPVLVRYNEEDVLFLLMLSITKLLIKLCI